MSIKQSNETVSFFSNLKKLKSAGWLAYYDDMERIRLKKNGTQIEHCPITAVCFEIKKEYFSWRMETFEAGERLGLSDNAIDQIRNSSDKGATIDDHGPRYCYNWGFHRPLRDRIEVALGLVSRLNIWRLMKARVHFGHVVGKPII